MTVRLGPGARGFRPRRIRLWRTIPSEGNILMRNSERSEREGATRAPSNTGACSKVVLRCIRIAEAGVRFPPGPPGRQMAYEKEI